LNLPYNTSKRLEFSIIQSVPSYSPPSILPESRDPQELRSDKNTDGIGEALHGVDEDWNIPSQEHLFQFVKADAEQGKIDQAEDNLTSMDNLEVSSKQPWIIDGQDLLQIKVKGSYGTIEIKPGAECFLLSTKVPNRLQFVPVTKLNRAHHQKASKNILDN
jgi:hypothetical protein